MPITCSQRGKDDMIMNSVFTGSSGLMVFVSLFALLGGVLMACALASAITGITFVWLVRFQKQAS